MAAQPGVHRASGTRILRDHLAARGATLVELDTSARPATAVCDALADQRRPRSCWSATPNRRCRSFLPGQLGPLGARVGTALRERLGRPPSFVAFEGCDTVTVLAGALRDRGTDRARVATSWPHVAVEGTRGKIRFTRTPGTGVWQWAWPPVQVTDRDPADPARFRILHTG